MPAPTLLVYQSENGQFSEEATRHQVHAIAVAGLPAEVMLITTGKDGQILSSIAMDTKTAMNIAHKLAECAGFSDAKADMKAGAVHQGSGRTH